MTQPWTLVTGASGFIGSRIVQQLVERGQRVKALVRAGSDLRGLQGLPTDRMQLAYGDITVSHTIYRALANCDRMFHVAATFEVWAPRPERVLDPAILGTRAVLEAARQRCLKKVVVTSSAGALGTTSSSAVMDETHEFNLADPETYVLAKYEADKIARQMSSEGLPLVIVMPTFVYGPGDLRPTPNGRALVEYLKFSAYRAPAPEGGINVADVDDVALGHLLAMEKGRVGESYILGGENVTYEQMFDMLGEITGLPVPRKISSGMLSFAAGFMELKARLRGGSPIITRRLVRDYVGSYVWTTSEKAQRDLGYSHRPARQTLSRAVRWFLQQGYVPEKSARRVRLELRPA
jgi:dihydroflavonol-4-reductase